MFYITSMLCIHFIENYVFKDDDFLIKVFIFFYFLYKKSLHYIKIKIFFSSNFAIVLINSFDVLEGFFFSCQRPCWIDFLLEIDTSWLVQTKQIKIRARANNKVYIKRERYFHSLKPHTCAIYLKFDSCTNHCIYYIYST